MLGALACPGGACAADGRADIPSDIVLQRFPVAKDGDGLLLPVKIGGKNRLFLVDTGSAVTVVDRALPLSNPRGLAQADTNPGVVSITIHDAPDASVGGIPLLVDIVAGIDLRRIREVCGQRIEGVLGMDFLCRHIVHIDFDRGEVLFLSSAPRNGGETLPIIGVPGETPQIEAWLTAEKKVSFLVDTGHVGGVGTMKLLEVRSLAGDGEFREVGSTLIETASGTSTSRKFQGKRIVLGGFRVDGPVFTETSGNARLGLGFWSRFVVTFDFPARRVHLRKGRLYERPDGWNRSGVHLVRRGEAIVVERVDRGSPGEAAGIRSGDVLLSLDGLCAEDTTLFRFHTALRGEGPWAFQVRRGGEIHRTTVRLSR